MTTAATTSRHLRGAGEVILLPKLRPGFVDTDETILSFGERLKTMLKALFELRRAAADVGFGDDAGPIERLRTVYDVQWTVLEREQCMLVAASFDRSWEDYFRLLYDVTGPLLDAIFLHCEAYRDFSSNFAGFIAWVRSVQRDCDFFYLANADSTTDDGRYVAQLLRNDVAAGKLRVEDPSAPPFPASEIARRSRDLCKAVAALYGLRKYFPDSEKLSGGRSAQAIFDSAMAGVLYSQRTRLEALVQNRLLPDPVSCWAQRMVHAEVERLNARNVAPTPVRLDAGALADIQGGVLRDYGQVSRGLAVLVHCPGREVWRRFLDHMLERVTTESQTQPQAAPHCNLALSFHGLQRVGLTAAQLRQFPEEFRQGMQARAGLLGDLDDPEYPHETAPFRGEGERLSMHAVDALVLFQTTASAEEAQAGFEAEIKALKRMGVRILFEQSLFRDLVRLPGGDMAEREPFGFLEGHRTVSSQPVPQAVLQGDHGEIDLSAGAAVRDQVALGELLLGYTNRHGENPHHGGESLLKNGTFLVIRKLEQDIELFERWSRQVAETLARSGGAPKAASDRLGDAKALLLGRKLDGSALASTAAGTNDWDYVSRETAHPDRCPLAAHVRRANPRTPNTPRILRRRYTFEDSCRDDGKNGRRGTFFMAINADIGGQFEVIQRWINGGNSTGTHSDRRDPIAGQRAGADLPYYVPDAAGSQQPVQLAWGAAVRLLWGGYFFMPSKSALRRLLQVRPHGDASLADAGSHHIERLMSLPMADARDAWKRMLEEPGSYERAAEVWASIRECHGGALHVPGVGVLVGSAPLAREILSDRGERFSVCSYQSRLRESLGEHYLAYDRVPVKGTCRYDEESATANAFFRSLSYESAFGLAAENTRKHIDALSARRSGTQRGLSDRVDVEVGPLAECVVARCAHQWLGLTAASKPSDSQLTDALHNAVLVSRYTFQMDPAPRLTAAARATQKHFAGTTGLQAELSQHMPNDAEVVRDRAAHGAAVGFAAPAIASIRSVLDLWADSGELWAIAEGLRVQKREDAWFKRRVVAALAARPVPSLLLRKALSGATVNGKSVTGERIILGLGSIYADASRFHLHADHELSSADTIEPPESWLFGGMPSPVGSSPNVGTSHGCPGREAALGVIAGTLAQLVRSPNLRIERKDVISFVPAPA